MRVAARNRDNFTKTFILGVLGHSRSSMLTSLRSLSPVLVMTRSMSVPICKHFQAGQANNTKITSFKREYPFSPYRSKGLPLPRGMKFCHEILETLSYHWDWVKTQSVYLTWSWIGTGS